jgi:hypothetical protein
MPAEIKTINSRFSGTGSKRKMTVTLSPKAARYFAFVAYGLTKEDGATPANHSECISHILEAMERFEEISDNDMLNWLNDVAVLDGAAREFAINPTQENLKKLISEPNVQVSDTTESDSSNDPDKQSPQ